MSTKAPAKSQQQPATQAAAPINMDALPPGGGSYTRQSDGTLVPTQPAEPIDTPAPQE